MTKKQNYGIVGKDFKFARPIGRVDVEAEAHNRYYLELCFNIQQFQKPERLSDSDLNDLEGCLNRFFSFHGLDHNLMRSTSYQNRCLKYRKLKQRVQSLLYERRSKRTSELIERTRLAAIVKVNADADHELAIDLTAAITKSIEKCCGYLYLKVWVMPDGNRWYKVGITNKPSRRDAEQNVLPVAAVTVKLVKLLSMDHARAAEKAIHLILDDRRIREANNRELFHLADPQLSALCEVLVQLGDEVVE
jgi:hypothetical protein